jgi:hypothetical protein
VSLAEDRRVLEAMKAAEEYMLQGMGQHVEEALEAVTGDAAVREAALRWYLSVEPLAWPNTWTRMSRAIEAAEHDERWLSLFHAGG